MSRHSPFALYGCALHVLIEIILGPPCLAFCKVAPWLERLCHPTAMPKRKRTSGGIQQRVEAERAVVAAARDAAGPPSLLAIYMVTHITTHLDIDMGMAFVYIAMSLVLADIFILIQSFAFMCSLTIRMYFAFMCSLFVERYYIVPLCGLLCGYPLGAAMLLGQGVATGTAAYYAGV